MNNVEYYGFTNFQTWKINLEIFAGLVEYNFISLDEGEALNLQERIELLSKRMFEYAKENVESTLDTDSLYQVDWKQLAEQLIMESDE